MKEAVKGRGIKIFIDMSAISLAYIFTLMLKFEENWLYHIDNKTLFFYLGFIWVMFSFLEIPKRSWTYTSLDGIIKIVQGVFISTFMLYIFSVASGEARSIYTYAALFFFSSGFCIAVRYSFMLEKSLHFHRGGKENLKTLIVGAGEAGGNLLRESLHNENFRYQIVGLIDDNPRKENMLLLGHKVLGTTKDLNKIIKSKKIGSVIIAIPSGKSSDIRRIYKIAATSGAQVKILPAFGETLKDEPYIKQIREVRVEDLLGREQHNINKEEVEQTIKNKTIFITGGGGSIGSELSRQICSCHPQKVVNIDINENSLYFLELELKNKFPDIEIFSEICSIKDKTKLLWLFDRYNPEIVFHTAAHKHVPLMEHNPEEAIKNNIFGTKNLVECADHYAVERFVLISTDKAVNPTSVMGATKRVCEMIVQNAAKKSSTKFMAVRFGNVLGSKGSVVPIFKNLIATGKNITLTHKEITRYFMTIPEAVQLVMEASSFGNGGEVFILDMGKPVRIMDLAKNMIELSGLKIGEDIDIDVIGLRPGEKLFEELLYDEDTTIKTQNKKIFISKLREIDIPVEHHLENLKILVDQKDREGIKGELKRCVKTYEEPEFHFSKELNKHKEDSTLPSQNLSMNMD
ncbi:UDP-4-dehydro-6-deoxy-2-acetamido-D-glucose 4-reductase [Propionigenium maris DSM 9537]|uniref:UDP-4-dehydro-6-deoxy-2-acetamido-D-glucose 4-reductase n=1 Tax=Propionigenium maris DSM 9537 TaxID=1123000 RepID=A0A9W6LMG9_9FUSO|nr:nucleoside-diphosphate sugar epimerase/dehydratase [Propionigenium maris]GLI55789.1 UDP-4-dehydro-6-deoxy-2-acetamido-D-glucose 4-reductase [Propionigenium maris DSM 9537]